MGLACISTVFSRSTLSDMHVYWIDLYSTLKSVDAFHCIIKITKRCRCCCFNFYSSGFLFFLNTVFFFISLLFVIALVHKDLLKALKLPNKEWPHFFGDTPVTEFSFIKYVPKLHKRIQTKYGYHSNLLKDNYTWRMCKNGSSVDLVNLALRIVKIAHDKSIEKKMVAADTYRNSNECTVIHRGIW